MAVTRLSAEERRIMVVDAAVAEFSRGGLEGTSTEDIARRAGISQPYLFRLFPTKKALFIAAVEAAFGRVVATFERVAKGLDGQEALDAMGEAYSELLSDRALLRLQLQAYAASDDVDVCEATRLAFRRTWAAVSGLSGVDGEQLAQFFATGMLCNVSAALRLDEINQEWARLCSKTSAEPAEGAPAPSAPAAPAA
jgi:AcrR family transcriptional regulator